MEGNYLVLFSTDIKGGNKCLESIMKAKCMYYFYL